MAIFMKSFLVKGPRICPQMRAFAVAHNLLWPCILTMFPAAGELRLRAEHKMYRNTS